MGDDAYNTIVYEVRCLQDAGRLPIWPTAIQRADWGYYNAKLSNPKVTREMAEAAVKELPVSPGRQA